MSVAVDMDTKTGFESHFLNEQSADVYFVCLSDDKQSEVRVPSHKIVLAAKSAPFQTMFYGSLPEKGDVSLPLVTASAFKEFLQLFYFNQIGATIEHVNEVVDLCKQYQMDYGLSVCGEFLKQNLTTDNFITFYEMALLYEMTELKSFCEISAPTMLTDENIVNCTRDEFKHILQIKQMYVDMDLVDICTKWAKKPCDEQQLDPENKDNIVQQIGDCVECFAFESMPQNKIQEVINMFDAVLTKDTHKQIMKILLQRGTPIDVDKILWCAKEREFNKRYIEPIEMMTVITNRMISLRAVGFAPVYLEDSSDLADESDPSVYGQLVILKHKANNEPDDTVLLRDSFNIEPIEDEPHTSKLVGVHRLETSVIFKPNQMYKIQVELMIRKKNEIYSRAKILDAGKHQYNRSTNPTEILFEGDSIIASLGIGIEYIDPQIVRVMLTGSQ